VGTIEGIHYIEDIWKAMTSEKVQVLMLLKNKSVRCSVKSTSTAGFGPIPMDISDQLATLKRPVQSHNSNQEGKCQSSSHRFIIIAPVNVVLAPQIGAQVVLMAPNSPECMKDAIGTDGLDHW
jgi:hypothetical protein